MPIGERWEGLEELERILRTRGRGVQLLSRTEHVSLFRVEGGARAGPSLEIIRVGDPGTAEEAWWRYGSPDSGARGIRRDLGGFVVGGREGAPPLPEGGRVLGWLGLSRFFAAGGVFGPRPHVETIAWKGRRSCSGCGHVFTELLIAEWKILMVRPHDPESGSEDDGPFTVSRRCPRCRDVEQGGLHLKGLEADLALGRALAYRHHGLVTREALQSAARIVEDVGGPLPLVNLLTRYGRPLGDLPLVGSLALEMYAAQARERALLELELEGLRARWRQEEELAALVDSDLTPVPRFRELLRKAKPGSPETS